MKEKDFKEFSNEQGLKVILRYRLEGDIACQKILYCSNEEEEKFEMFLSHIRNEVVKVGFPDIQIINFDLEKELNQEHQPMICCFIEDNKVHYLDFTKEQNTPDEILHVENPTFETYEECVENIIETIRRRKKPFLKLV